MLRMAALVLSAVFNAAAMSQVDLATKYPATLDRSDPPAPLEWSCEAGDVWSLSSFRFAQGDELRIETGPATVAFGHNSTNVVFAVVTPETPSAIAGKHPGRGDPAVCLWMRFHPARVAELFPASTVRGPGDAAHVLNAKRVANWKMQASMQSNGLPVLPQREWVIFDVDTAAEVRRYYFVDTSAGSVKYESAFESRVLPKSASIESADALRAFDQVWSDFDREYAMFGIRPQVNWEKLKAEYRPRAEKTRDEYELASVLNDLLKHLEDLHILVRLGEETLPGFTRPRPLNGNWKACEKAFGGLKQDSRDSASARTDDGIGYINIFRLNDNRLPQGFDRALESLSDTWALIIDLRFNGGGGEPIAQRVAGRFTDEEQVYSKSRYRSGAAHDNLTEPLPRTITPRGPWTYRAPVIVLQGRKTLSSAESFVLMLAQCPNVTTMGDATGGSSGNPRIINVAKSIAVHLPRWIDLEPSGKPIDTVGVLPRVEVATKDSDFSDRADPVLEAALRQLRAMAPESRKPGKRD